MLKQIHSWLALDVWSIPPTLHVSKIQSEVRKKGEMDFRDSTKQNKTKKPPWKARTESDFERLLLCYLGR